MSSFTTTVEGGTLAEIEEAAYTELSRFFDAEVNPDFTTRALTISPHTLVGDGRGQTHSITYQAEVTVTW